MRWPGRAPAAAPEVPAGPEAPERVPRLDGDDLDAAMARIAERHRAGELARLGVDPVERAEALRVEALARREFEQRWGPLAGLVAALSRLTRNPVHYP